LTTPTNGTTPEESRPAWMNELDTRQINEVYLARLYAKTFAHGTDGHSRLMLIAKLAELLDQKEVA
jgi:hypothetical protein